MNRWKNKKIFQLSSDLLNYHVRKTATMSFLFCIFGWMDRLSFITKSYKSNTGT